MLLLTVLLLAASPGDALLKEARPLVGLPYDLGGRLQPGRGTDCQGIVFYAAERVQRCTWKSFSVLPTTTVAARELGDPVLGVSPVHIRDLDIALLQPGDVLLFLNATANPAEPALTVLDDTAMWVWHMGLYAGEGRVLHADPYARVVVEEDLRTLLSHHGAWVQGITALRLSAPPTPRTCRRGARMPSVDTRKAP